MDKFFFSFSFRVLYIRLILNCGGVVGSAAVPAADAVPYYVDHLKIGINVERIMST